MSERHELHSSLLPDYDDAVNDPHPSFTNEYYGAYDVDVTDGVDDSSGYNHDYHQARATRDHNVFTNEHYGEVGFEQVEEDDDGYAFVEPDENYQDVVPSTVNRAGSANWTREEVKHWLQLIVHEDAFESWEDLVDYEELTGRKLLAMTFQGLRKMEENYYQIYADIEAVWEGVNILRASTGARRLSTTTRRHVSMLPDDEVDWWHGKISREEADLRLRPYLSNSGTFLIRQRREIGTFALSLTTGSRIVHYLLTPDHAGHLTLNGRTLAGTGSVEDAVNALRNPHNNPLPCGLTEPCPKPINF